MFPTAAVMWTVGMAKPDMTRRGSAQQTWDPGDLALS